MVPRCVRSRNLIIEEDITRVGPQRQKLYYYIIFIILYLIILYLKRIQLIKNLILL